MTLLVLRHRRTIDVNTCFLDSMVWYHYPPGTEERTRRLHLPTQRNTQNNGNIIYNVNNKLTLVSTSNSSYQLTIHNIHQNSAIILTPQASWWTYNDNLHAEQKRRTIVIFSKLHFCLHHTAVWKFLFKPGFILQIRTIMKLCPVLIAYLLWNCYRNLWPTFKFVLFTSSYFFSMKRGFFIAQSIHILFIMSKLQLNSLLPSFSKYTAGNKIKNIESCFKLLNKQLIWWANSEIFHHVVDETTSLIPVSHGKDKETMIHKKPCAKLTILYMVSCSQIFHSFQWNLIRKVFISADLRVSSMPQYNTTMQKGFYKGFHRCICRSIYHNLLQIRSVRL